MSVLAFQRRTDPNPTAKTANATTLSFFPLINTPLFFRQLNTHCGEVVDTVIII
jgi:hypothetical protein